uniref:Truncated spectinomycin 9-O-adenylyltransferase n=1 Tax=Salmonella typhimurium TaxID=90371 RepID=A0A2S1XV38_SALTM|nr:truncated spectinomycin 9-O-adenylyltransferase [Salmonella enterica subsp. enterica serovar Typhimurium]
MPPRWRSVFSRLAPVAKFKLSVFYLGQKEDHLASRADHLEEFIRFVKGEIIKSVGK